jgi:hypothetical protein
VWPWISKEDQDLNDSTQFTLTSSGDNFEVSRRDNQTEAYWLVDGVQYVLWSDSMLTDEELATLYGKWKR